MFLITDVHPSSDLILFVRDGRQFVTVRPYRIVGTPPPPPSLADEDLDSPENWQRAIEHENFYRRARTEPNPLPMAGETFRVRSNAEFIELLEKLAALGYSFPLDYIDHIRGHQPSTAREASPRPDLPLHPIQANSLKDALKATTHPVLRRFSATVTQRRPKAHDRNADHAILVHALAISTTLAEIHPHLLERESLRIAIFSAEPAGFLDGGAWAHAAAGFLNQCPGLQIDQIWVSEWSDFPQPVAAPSPYAGLSAPFPRPFVYDDPLEYPIDECNPDLIIVITPDWDDPSARANLSGWAHHVFERGGPLVVTTYDRVSAEKLRHVIVGLGLGEPEVHFSRVIVPLEDEMSPPSSYNSAFVDIGSIDSPGAFVNQGALAWASTIERELLETMHMSGNSYEAGTIVEHEGRKLALGLRRVAVDIANGDTFKIDSRGRYVPIPTPSGRDPWTPLSEDDLPHVWMILETVRRAFSVPLFGGDLGNTLKDDISDPKRRAEFIESLVSGLPETPQGGDISQERMREIMEQMFGAMAGTSGVAAKNPLFLAASSNDPSALEAAISKCRDINQKDGESWTALMEASAKNAVDSARVLLQHGANPDIHNAMGHTAVSIAITHGAHETLLALLEAGADLDLETSIGTPRELLSRVDLSPAVSTWLSLRGIRG